jgi:hypothetical protein
MFTLPFRRRLPERHLPYFKFLKAVEGPGCPLCAQVRLAMDEWYENLLYESANDRSLRKRLHADRGLCARHAHRLCDTRDCDGLGAAVLFRSQLEPIVEALARRESPPLNAGSCVACGHESDAEARYLGLVADFLEDEAMRAALSGAGGLCLDHLGALLKRRGTAPAWFLELHRERSAALLGTLVRYIDSFRLSTEERWAAQTREEELAWKGVATFLHGAAGKALADD